MWEGGEGQTGWRGREGRVRQGGGGTGEGERCWRGGVLPWDVVSTPHMH